MNPRLTRAVVGPFAAGLILFTACESSETLQTFARGHRRVARGRSSTHHGRADDATA